VKGLLEQEEVRIRLYYSDYIALLGDDLRKNPLDFMSVEKEYKNATKLVRENRSKAETYTDILRQLASLHADLKTDFLKDGNVPQTGEKFDKYCQDLFKTFQNKAAEKEAEIKLETMQRVQKTIDKHVRRIEPLIKELESALQLKVLLVFLIYFLN
jgi:hypothetical protein